MTHFTTPQFWQFYNALPPEVRDLADRNFALLKFLVCVDNTEYPAALERRKIYQVLPDEQAEQHAIVRVIDESGEDYLYPSDYFLAVELPLPVAAVTCAG